MTESPLEWKENRSLSELGVSSLSPLHSPGAMQPRDREEADRTTSEVFSTCTASGVISLAAMFPGAALYFIGAAGQNRCVYQQVIWRSSFLLLFKDWCQNCAAIVIF